MANRASLAALALAIAGILSIAASLATGSAHVYLLLFFIPVLTGASAWFLAGVLCLALAMVLFVLSLGNWEEPTEPHRPVTDGSPPEGSSTGGFLLIGPIPIFFGSARSLGDRYYWVAVLAGAALFAALLAVFYLG